MNELLQILIPILMMIESGGDPNAIGDEGRSVGVLQISEAVVNDVNRVYGTHFTPEDRKDVDKSRRICELYLRHWAKDFDSLEAMARIWNGGPRGHIRPCTLKYWLKVKAILEKEV